MSRVGNRLIKIEAGVTVNIAEAKAVVSADNGILELAIPKGLAVAVTEQGIKVSRLKESPDLRAQHGLFARLLSNTIVGVARGFSKVLEFSGTGYRVAVVGSEIVLNMGYSHEIRLSIPKDLALTVVKNTITISGKEKDLVGEFAAQIRSVRPPEVYKGKGIKYKGEFIKRKAGKTAASK